MLLPFLQPGELVLLELEAQLSSSTLGHLMSAALLEPPTPWHCSRVMRGPQFPTLRDRGAAAKFVCSCKVIWTHGFKAFAELDRAPTASAKPGMLFSSRRVAGVRVGARRGLLAVRSLPCQAKAFSCKQLSPGARHRVRNWYHCSQQPHVSRRSQLNI